MALTFATITTSLNAQLATFEGEIETKLSNPDPTASELLDMQKAVTEFTLFLNTHSTIMKTLSDELKAILQKIS